jgi:hypothetical protein
LRVLLLNPPANDTVIRDYYCSKTTKSNYLFQPIDLLMQSGILAERHELSAVDAVAGRMSRGRCLERIERISPDVILGLWGAVTDTGDREFYKELSQSNAPLFITGEIFLDDPAAWLAEYSFVKGLLLRFVSEGFADYLDTGAPGPDFMVRKDGAIIGGFDPDPPREFALGRPRHELFGHHGYRFSFGRGKKFATVLTDFGCPYKCGFCVMSGLGYRTRPVDEVINEWRWLKQRGISELFVTDQCFGASRERSLALCEAWAREVPGMGWTTFTRADLLDRTLLAAVRDAGCHTLIMGVESADSETLKAYHKGMSADKVKQGFSLCREMGIRTVATFIIGLPEDTGDSIRVNMHLARELDPDFVSYNVAVPRASTELKIVADQEGLADPNIDPDQGGETVSMNTRALSRDQVARLKKQAYRDFYLRPGYLLRRLAAVRSPSEFAAQIREGVALIFRNL